MSFQPLLHTGLLLLFILPYSQEPKTVGEIVEIGCSAEFKKTKNDKEEPLDAKRDRGRKIRELELYRCKDGGILKIRFNSGQDVDVTTRWYPIPETSDGNSNDTGGRPNEEMVWLNGSFKLNSFQNEGSTESLDELRALFSRQHSNNTRLVFGVAEDFSPPQNLSVAFNNSILTVASTSSDKFAFSVDGSTQRHQLPDGTKWELTALNQKKSISIDWNLADKVRSDIFVEPKGDNEIVVTRKIFVSDNPNPFITRMSYIRVPIKTPLRKSFAEETSVTEALVTELMEPIDSKENGSFVLRVKEPIQYSGAIIRGRFFKTFWSVGTAGTLVMEIKSIEVPSGGSYDIRGIVEKISAQNGATISFASDYPDAADRFLQEFKAATAKRTSTGPSSSSGLDKDITIPKGSVFVLKALINKQ